MDINIIIYGNKFGTDAAPSGRTVAFTGGEFGEQSVQQEKVRFYSESFEEILIFLFWHNSAHKALGRTHLINRPVAVVLDNSLAPSGHALD